ncbi:transposase [Rhodopseudomonas rhenobacensis]|uniref:Transposase n=1 Tax=Rhodopseudomonas rhenobacensis TaxID=87461 RepID=A0A7W7Z132_9BRAD|nr:transposase [Rhodopseudomonas rhenobacensis]
MLLGLEDVEQAAACEAAGAEQVTPAARQAGAAKRRANRGALPAHLPRIETTLDIDDKTCRCCQGALHRIGEDKSERLDIVPAQFRVLVTIRPKYACRQCEDGIVQALAPARLIEGGMPTETTIAQVLVSKYAPIASEALQRIAALYAIEKDIRGRSAEERRLVRQQKSRPLIDALEPWLRTKLGLISQKGKLAEAINYALSRWEGLTRFLDDGRIELDNNTVERSIRPITLNRKNALFAGSDGGAEHWATIASLIETCKLNDIDPLGYLTDVLTRIANGHPNRDIEALLPWAYQKQDLRAVA